MLDNLLGFLKTEYKPGAGAFLQLDAQTLADKLGLKKRGAANGAMGLPPSAIEVLDEVEHEVVSAIRSVGSEAHARTHDQLSTYAQRLKSADISGAAAAMTTSALQAEGAFEAEIVASTGKLRRARLDAVEYEEALSKFKSRHRLERPSYPPRDKTILSAILIILFAVEVIPNAVILGEGEQLGVLGGITQATIYSFLNISFGFLAGRLCWTNAIHRNWMRKLLGVLGSMAIMVFIVGLNLALAHYRALAPLMPSTEAIIAAWHILFSAEALQIADLKSAGMVAMGILFSFIAMIEGWLWQDPYPGYAAISRHHRDAEDTYHDQVNETIGYLKEVEERVVNEIKVERSRLRDRRQEIPLVLEERRRLIARFEGHIAHLQDVGRHLLSIYRSANRAARKPNDAAPAHFNSMWQLDGFERISVDDSLWDSPDEQYQKADQALEASIGRLQASLQRALGWIKRVNAARTMEDIHAVMDQE